VANVQIDDGKFTRIANALLEALAWTRITSEARRCFDVVLRQTYGWNKKHATISYTQFSEATGMTPAHAFRAVKSLIAHRLIERCSTGYCIQKDYEKWVPYSKRGVSKRGEGPTPNEESLPSPNEESLPTPNEESPTPSKPNNGNGSRRAKDSIKDNIKTSLSLSLSHATKPVPGLTAEREKLEKRIKTLFPQCVSIPKGITTEKLFLFVYRLHRGEIKAEGIGSPVAYMKGMLSEDVGPLLQKIEAEARARAARAEKDRQDREARERHREDNGAEMSEMIREFVAQLEGKHAVGV
jgi:phage replication O-like protein O